MPDQAERHPYVVTATPPWAPETRVFIVWARSERAAEHLLYQTFPECLELRENLDEEHVVEVKVYAVDFLGTNIKELV